MPVAKDEVGNQIAEGDYLVFNGGRGRIAKIEPILQQGPYNGGVRVSVHHEIDFALPPGHTNIVGVHKVFPSAEEMAKDERLKSGKTAEKSFLEK